jgi:hypothetical protein
VKRKPRPKRPPIGSVWRMLAHPIGGGAPVRFGSDDCPDPTRFDELVIEGVLHVEQMASNHWWFNAGDLHVDVVIRRGKPVVSWWEDKK